MPANRELSTSKCPLCGNLEGNRILYELSRPIIRCGACDLVFAAAGAAGSERQSYSETYYHQGVYADYLGDRTVIHRNTRRTLSELERLVTRRTLLDVGCAAGFFLEAARARGWTVRGLDVSSYASEYARRELQLDVETGSIESLTKASSKFHVITMWDTIEHLNRPDLALTNIRSLLHPGGVLALSTGDYGSLLRRLTGRKWRLFADPTHNFFFDENRLKVLLNQTGYESIRVMHRGKWVSLAMALHQSPLPFSKLARKRSGAIRWNPSLYVNLYDVMTVFAKAVD